MQKAHGGLEMSFSKSGQKSFVDGGDGRQKFAVDATDEGDGSPRYSGDEVGNSHGKGLGKEFAKFSR